MMIQTKTLTKVNNNVESSDHDNGNDNDDVKSSEDLDLNVLKK